MPARLSAETVKEGGGEWVSQGLNIIVKIQLEVGNVDVCGEVRVGGTKIKSCLTIAKLAKSDLSHPSVINLVIFKRLHVAF